MNNTKDILKLKLLLLQYKYELLKGNTEHIKDLVAIMVIIENDTEWKKVYYLNLNYLLWTNDYKVPTLEEIVKRKKELKKVKMKLKHKSERVATTWIEWMLKTGMIKEGQDIKLSDYNIMDFITDERIKKMYNESTQESNKILKK